MTAFRLYEPHELGKDGYPPEWHRLSSDAPSFGIKDAVRAEAGYRCVRCKHPYREGGEWSECDERCLHRAPYRYEWNGIWESVFSDDVNTAGQVKNLIGSRVIQAQWRVLTVHHLDGNKANCRWWNLAALCQRCHLQIQGKVKMERVWPWEHTDWFKPYVAGYYAFVYLHEDLDRAQTEARLDKLLALERQA